MTTHKTVRIPVYADAELVDEIDAWRERQEGEPSRSDAFRRMARRVLKADAERAAGATA